MKKAKRFQSGNLVTQGYTGGPRVSYDSEEEKLKKEGLEASKNERVGLFERLRMGNISDPRSEAYKRFGAGRGAAERSKMAAPAPSIRSTDSGMGVPGFGAPVMPKPAPETEAAPRMPASMPVGLRSAVEGAGEAAPKVMEKETTTVKTPRNTVTQTKKAVAKPDMAKEKVGKGYEEVTERLRKAPPKTSKEENISAPGGKFIEKNVRTFKGVERPDDRSLGARLKKGNIPVTDNEMFAYLKNKNKERLARKEDILGRRQARNLARSGSTVGKMPGPSLSSDPYAMTLGSDLDPKAMMRRNARLSGDGDFKKGGKIKAKPVKKYASGGSVSSASKRADGIAKKGKTKGRII